MFDPSLIAVVLLAMITAFPVGTILAVCALAAQEGRRRYVLLAAAVAALLASAVTMLPPSVLTRVAGPLLLGLGTIGALIVGVVILYVAAAGTIGLIAAPLAAPLAGPPGMAERSCEFLAVRAGGLAGGAVSILAIAAVLLVLRRAVQAIRTGIALGGVAAALAIGAELALGVLSSQAVPLTTTTTLMVTALGLVAGTLLGAMRADASGALAGMPPGNH